MKKILAGILATASLMAMSVGASAASNDKNVTKAGELTYDVAVTAPKVVLNLVMPAKMTAALNPYGAAIKIGTKPTSESDSTPVDVSMNTGIASVAYTITNKSQDYGVYLDATAITTITTTDKPKADKSPAWGVVTDAITTAQGVKNANLALMTFADISTMAGATKPVAASNAVTSSKAGNLVLDSTVAADKANGVAAGQTSQKKFAFIPAAKEASGKVTDGTLVMGFVGVLGTSKADGSADVEWKEDDAINVNLVLKVTAGPKELT